MVTPFTTMLPELSLRHVQHLLYAPQVVFCDAAARAERPQQLKQLVTTQRCARARRGRLHGGEPSGVRRDLGRICSSQARPGRSMSAPRRVGGVKSSSERGEGARAAAICARGVQSGRARSDNSARGSTPRRAPCLIPRPDSASGRC
jgi:hypothetical protein